MKDLHKYGLLKDDEWDLLPWVDYDPRPPFRIWVTPEEIAPFFIIEHHPYSISLPLRIGDKFKADVFRRLGLKGGSDDWEMLARRLIEQYEEENSGIDLFKFDSDEDVFCIFSEYVDDVMKLARYYIMPACADESAMIRYLR